MKKLLLALVLWTSGTVAALAQVGYDLEFSNFKIEENSVQTDTVHINCTYNIVGTIHNNGPGIFPGFSNMLLNVYVHNDTSVIDHATLVPDFTLSPFNLPAINANASVNVSRPLFISDDYFQPDTGNIVIVWPSDTYKDDNTDNNYSNHVPVWVPADTNHCGTLGMPETYGGLRFAMFPNPANENLHLNFWQMNQEGAVVLMDMMGHTVYSTKIAKGELELTLPLAKNLADGLYFVSVRMGSKVGVSKLQVKH